MDNCLGCKDQINSTLIGIQNLSGNNRRLSIRPLNTTLGICSDPLKGSYELREEELVVHFSSSSCPSKGAEIFNYTRLSYDNGVYYLHYRIDDGPLQVITKEYEDPQSTGYFLRSFYEKIYDENGWQLIDIEGGGLGSSVTGEYHPCPFQSYEFKFEIKAASLVTLSEQRIEKPIKLEIVSVPDYPGIDVVNLTLGKSTTLLSCAYIEWPGY